MKNILLLITILSSAAFCQNKNENKSNENWQLGNFVKPATNPIMQADSSYLFNCPVKKEIVKWQKADVFNPAAIVRNNKVYVLFRAEDVPGVGIGMRTSRIGIAVSNDGIHFKKNATPVLYPDSSKFIQYDYPGGCEDPRIVETEKGSYVLMYTSWNRDVARLSVATSNDLYHWKKQGPAFLKAYDGKFLNIWSKSGSIVTKEINGKFVATKINGKYWMYWGEGPIYLASSSDLINWQPVTDADKNLISMISKRPKMFDSQVVEPGPPAIITAKGILLLYNGKNAENEDADPKLAKGIYCGGQALFDAKHPEKLLERCSTYFIKPDLPHEISGQYTAGTTFIEGLILFKNQYFLYYGTADSMVGVAVKKK
jgi:beta-1,2-mannosidase